MIAFKTQQLWLPRLAKVLLSVIQLLTDAFPLIEGAANFNRELDMSDVRVDGGISVIYDNEWYLCTPKDKQ